jgi:sulfur carrier protein
MGVNVTVNGRTEIARDGVTLWAFLDEKGINPDTVVVELNRDIVPKQQFDLTHLKENDTLEVLRFVGGG